MNMMLTNVSFDRPSEADGLWGAVEAIETQIAALKKPHGPIRSICDEIGNSAQQLRDFIDIHDDHADAILPIIRGLESLIRQRRI